MKPILINVPEVLETERLTLRMPRQGDAAEINRAVQESFKELHAWMPWAKLPPTVEETEIYSRTALAKFHLRELLDYRAYLKSDGTFAGNLGLFNIDWDVRCFEIGYWLRTSLCGNGYMTEAVQTVTTMAIETLKANRVEIRCDENNGPSRGVAERLGFALEGILRNHSHTPEGKLRNACVYAATPVDWTTKRASSGIK